MSDTPRTDAMLTQHFQGRSYVLKDDAIKLENELNEASRLYHLASALAKAGDELREQMRIERNDLIRRSIQIDPSISDKFEIKDNSVFVIRNGTAYLAGIRELCDMAELVDARSELAKLRTAATEKRHWVEDDWDLNELIDERNQWREVAEDFAEVLGQSDTHNKWLKLRIEATKAYEKLKGEMK